MEITFDRVDGQDRLTIIKDVKFGQESISLNEKEIAQLKQFIQEEGV